MSLFYVIARIEQNHLQPTAWYASLLDHGFPDWLYEWGDLRYKWITNSLTDEKGTPGFQCRNVITRYQIGAKLDLVVIKTCAIT